MTHAVPQFESGPSSSWVLVPVFPQEVPASVRITAVVSRPAEGRPRGLVSLGSTWFTRSVLGALADGAGSVLAWLEIVVQTPSGAAVLPARGGPVTNAEVDARWRRWCAAQAIVGGAWVRTGYEDVPAPVLWLDPVRGVPVEARDPGTGRPLALCRDDGVLLASGAESYADGVGRCAWVPGEPGAGLFGLGVEAPSGTRPISEALAAGATVPLNPEGGMLLVRKLAPLEWTAAAALFSGERPSLLLPGGVGAVSGLDVSQGFLFGSERSKAGLFIETFHLKLLLLRRMLEGARRAVACLQAPLLNLNQAAFRVAPAPGESIGLPAFWALGVALAAPPEARAVELPGAGLRYYETPNAGPSIYRPDKLSAPVRGTATLRLRRVEVDGTRAQVEGTLESPDLVRISRTDIVSVRCPLPNGSLLPLHGSPDAADALTGGECRFRADVDRGSALWVDQLKSAEGGVFSGVSFESIPVLSPAVDLFSIGVLAVQLLVARDPARLPVAVDEAISFARALDGAVGRTPAERAAALASADPRWVRALGAQHHGHGVSGPEEAFSLLPLEVWWDALAVVVRYFPGAGAFSHRRDAGDAPPGKVEAVFDAPLADLDRLILRTQALLFSDWMRQREVARLIGKVKAEGV